MSYLCFTANYALFSMPRISQDTAGIPVLLETLCNSPSCNGSEKFSVLPSKQLKFVDPVSDGKSVFVFGGLVNAKTFTGSSETYQLNLASGEWTKKRSMSSKRYGHFAVQVNDEEFWIGGKVGWYAEHDGLCPEGISNKYTIF